MEMSVAHRKETRDHLTYFLAGDQVPSGRYRDVQTGREIQVEEAGALPASCDGHVAVYIRQARTWAEIHDCQESA